VKTFLTLLLVCCGLLARAEDGPLVLAGTWKAKLIHPLPSAPSLDKAHLDQGVSPEALAAIATGFDDASWQGFPVPANWESYGGDWASADGEAVFRLAVDIPARFIGKDLELRLGAIDDFDDTFVNGQAVGRTDKNVLGYWACQRVYRISASLVHEGRNVIAVRIFDHFGGGGFTGPREQLLLSTAP